MKAVNAPGVANFLVYIAGGAPRDEARIKAFAQALKLSLYDAKIMLGAPGPRRVAAFATQEEADLKCLDLRQAGLVGFVVDKARFSRLPRVFKALKAVEQPDGLLFTIETPPAAGEIQARISELPQPKGFVRAVLLGFYTQVTVHTESGRGRAGSSSSTSEIREPFIHLYSEDPHTILEIAGPKVEIPWAKEFAGILGDMRWLKMGERFASYYGALLDTTLFKNPAEVNFITAPLNVDAVRGIGGSGARGGASSQDDSPVAMAASRIIVYSRVFGI